MQALQRAIGLLKMLRAQEVPHMPSPEVLTLRAELYSRMPAWEQRDLTVELPASSVAYFRRVYRGEVR